MVQAKARRPADKTPPILTSHHLNGPGTLQPRRMPHIGAPWIRAGSRRPDGALRLLAVSRVQAQTRNVREDVPVPGVNRDPIPLTRPAVLSESRRGKRAVEQTGVNERIAHRSRTIVTVIFHPGVPAAVNIGPANNTIRRLDGAHDFLRGPLRWNGLSPGKRSRPPRTPFVVPRPRRRRTTRHNKSERQRRNNEPQTPPSHRESIAP